MLKNKLQKCVEAIGGEYAYVIKNLNTGETFTNKENIVVPSASLIKMLVMIEVFRQIKEGKLTLSKRLSVKPEEKVAYSVLEFLDFENTYTLLDMVKLMIIYSDNTAANILIDLVGMENVNKCIEELGLKKTRLQRKMIDLKAREECRENYTTAAEMADIMERLYMGEIIDKKNSDLILNIMKGQGDESMMRVDLPDDIVIARKSGELESLNHDIAIVYGNKCNYIYVFFVWGTETNNNAREILQKTSKIVYDYFQIY